MQIKSTSGKTLFLNCQIDGAGSDIVEGALLMPGVSDETNRGVLIQASGAALNAVGILKQKHTGGALYDAASDTGLIYNTRLVQAILPGDQVVGDLSFLAADDVAVASYTSATATITSMEDDMDGGWAYCYSGTGAGQLGYITSAATTGITFKAALTTALDNTSLLMVLRPNYWALTALNAAADGIRTLNTVGTLPWHITASEVKLPGSEGWVKLDYTKHSGLSGLNVTGFGLRQIMAPSGTHFNPIA